VGLAVGIGFYEAAVMGGFGVFFVMTVMQGLDTRVHSKAKSLGVYVELDRETSLGEFLREAQEKKLDVRDVQRESGGENGSRAYTVTIRAEKRRNLTELSDEVRDLPGVLFLECL
jgi:putative Mg2+ transporter-C (MgtC) family protein